MFNTPILYIIFNRLETVKQTFPKIKEIQPKRLFIAADGSRKGKEGEDRKCQRVREWVLSQINWDCKIHTLFQEKNLGCGQGPVQAITWFFNNVEQGIILEDDCLPSKSFFQYCETLLNYYKNDTRVMQISGTNRLTVSSNDSYSYFFTNYPSEWGWASWRRAWSLYDYKIIKWNNNETKGIIADLYGEYYNNVADILDQTINIQNLTWWDYQWTFIKNINSGLTITPCYNLVSNIGFDEDATHTYNKDSPFYNIKSYEISFPLIHPSYIYKSINLEKKILALHFSISKKTYSLKDCFLYKILKKILKYFLKIKK